MMSKEKAIGSSAGVFEQIWEFTLILGRGSGQVFFQENALTGLLFLVAISYGALAAGVWQIAVGAPIGLIVSTVTAYIVGGDKGMIKAGLYGFNGILVGTAFPTFLVPDPIMWISLIIASGFSTLVFMAMARCFERIGITPSTGPFVFTGWVFMLAAYAFAHPGISSLPNPTLWIHPHMITPDSKNAILFMTGGAFGPALEQFLRITGVNIAQVFLIDNPWAGLIIMVGLLCNGWKGFFFAFMGAAIAVFVAAIGGAPNAAIVNGLYGFSSVLTALAVGYVFIEFSKKSILYSAFACVITVIFNATIVMALMPIGVPAFTSAYNLAMYLFVGAKKFNDKMKAEKLEKSQIVI